MSDDPDGPVDVIVEGHARNRFRSWRLEVFRVEHNHLISRWNSDSSVQGDEFDMVSETRVHVDTESKNYEITLSGCAQHLCSDGVSGFLLYLGRTSAVAKAKVVATDLTRSPDVRHTYEVTFSKGIDASSMEILKREISKDRTITSKSGLPFPCKIP